MPSNRFKYLADEEARKVSEEKLKVSFEYLDWESEEFFFTVWNKPIIKKFLTA